MTSKTRTFSPSLLFFCIFSFLWPSLPWSDLHRYAQICHSLGLCSSLHTPYREPHGNYTAEEEQLRVRAGARLLRGTWQGWILLLQPWDLGARLGDPAVVWLEGGERLLLSEGNSFSNPGCSSHPKHLLCGSNSSSKLEHGGFDRPWLAAFVACHWPCP